MIKFTFSYNRLGRNAEEADAEEIIDMANKASLADQQKQVRENVHSQVSSFCRYMDDTLLLDHKAKDNQATSHTTTNSSPRSSGIGLAVGGNSPLKDHIAASPWFLITDKNFSTAVPETKALQRTEVSQRLKDLMGYTLEVKPSQISHEDAGKGLFLQGEANIGSVLAFYPGEKPLAFAHFANHPAKGTVPNVMVCPCDFPLLEKDMRPYIPNVSFGNDAETEMRRFGSFTFKSRKSSNNESNAVPVLKTLVLVATRAICDEEVLLNYRLSNSEHIPSWYTPVDEEDH
ncbi:hypothetical protein RND71_031382 [Anisodus tanguticus]|uniref:SET domain-containing protein n=1 Tax=Anisodus tanguticus TaxID=243964 RepID=A0AAE1RD86_9SOLA|nr:hypothetical protein RND71_031382 [Anisodus tanguticus]